jgi:dTDP-4-amino-4,6-dideoxygalactose transaminase
MGFNMEIGSEFHLEKYVNEKKSGNIIWNFNQMIFTSSGRGALALLLEKLNPKMKTVLLPNYLCDSIIQVFVKYGYQCKFYYINTDLTPEIGSIHTENVGVFFHMGYFGGKTNGSLYNLLKDMKSKSIIIVEDITHTLFSTYSRCWYNDYYFGSIRKWIGVPSGGILASNDYEVNATLPKDELFSTIRKEALSLKSLYLSNKEETTKIKFRELLATSEKMLEEFPYPYEIDEESLIRIQQLDAVSIIEKRRHNFLTLHGLLQGISIIPVYPHLDMDECPLFYPIYIKDRDLIRTLLVKENIYCPVHWPVPLEVKDHMPMGTKKIYDTILSIPCDQRYNTNDMNRVADSLKQMGVKLKDDL